jgi:hypothetical protein
MLEQRVQVPRCPEPCALHDVQGRKIRICVAA